MHFDRAHAVFDRLIDVPAPERAALAEELCGGDRELLALVHELLAADAGPSALDTATGIGLPAVLAREVGARELPEDLGRFRIVRELGRGGMGVVYEAVQDLPRRRVALKTLRAFTLQGEAARQRFRAEVDATALVVHPGIPQVYEVFEHDGLPVMAMELVEGRPIVDATGGLDTPARLRLLARAADAVHAAHAGGVVHRDIKPSNVMVDARGQPRVLDFGIASLGRVATAPARERVASAASLDDEALAGSGTLAYAAPEQLRGQPADVRGDVYGLGALAWHVLLGAAPLPGGVTDLEGVLAAKEHGPAVPPGRLPRNVAAVVERALAVDPADRYPSAAALAADLRRAADGRPARALVDDPLAVLRVRLQQARRHLPLALVGAALAVGVVGVVAVAGTALRDATRARAADAALVALQRTHPAATGEAFDTAFDRFTEDPEHAGTAALSEAFAWRAAHRAGPARRADLATAWTTATTPTQQRRALEALAAVLVGQDDWPALRGVLERLPQDATPAARLHLALWDRDAAAARALLPPTHAALADLLAGAAPLGLPSAVGEAAREHGADVRFAAAGVVVQAGAHRVVLRPDGTREVTALPAGGRHVDTADGQYHVEWLAGRRRSHRLARDGVVEELEVTEGAVMQVVVADLDADGTLERYTGVGPYARTLLVADPASGPSRTLHPPTNDLYADFRALVAHDLDGDGRGELLAGSFGWWRYDLRVLAGAPAAPEVVGRIRMGVNSVAVRADGDVWVVGPTLRSAPGAPTPTVLVRARWTGDGLAVAETYPLADAGWLVLGDLDGDGREDVVVRRDGGSIVGMTRPDGTVALVDLPGMAILGVGSVDTDPAVEAIVSIDGDLWLLDPGTRRGAPRTPERPPAAARPPEGLPAGPRLRWQRSEDLVALGLVDEGVAALETLASRADEVGRAADRRLLELGDPAAARAAARRLLGRSAPTTADREAARRALRRVGDLASSRALGLAGDLATHTLVGDDALHPAVHLARPGAVRFRRGEGVRLRAGGGLGPVVRVPLHADAPDVGVTLGLDVDTFDWGGRLRLTLADDDPQTPDLVATLGRGGGGPADHHHLSWACGGGAAVTVPWSAGPHTVRLTAVDGRLHCHLDGATLDAPQPLSAPTGDVLLSIEPLGSRGVGAFDLRIGALDVVGLTPGAPLPPPVWSPLDRALGATTPAPDPALTPDDYRHLLRVQPSAWTGPALEALGADRFLETWFTAYEAPIYYLEDEGLDALLHPAFDRLDLAAPPPALEGRSTYILLRARARALAHAGRDEAALEAAADLDRAGHPDRAAVLAASLRAAAGDRDGARDTLAARLAVTDDRAMLEDAVADRPELRGIDVPGLTFPPSIAAPR